MIAGTSGGRQMLLATNQLGAFPAIAGKLRGASAESDSPGCSRTSCDRCAPGSRAGDRSVTDHRFRQFAS